MNSIGRMLMLFAAALSPAFALAHGDHQHIGSAFALWMHLASHVDYQFIVMLAVVGVAIWVKSSRA